MKDRKYRGIYNEIFELLGEEAVDKIFKFYRGQQVNFPMTLYSDEYMTNYINLNYDGINIRDIARELGYSERWIKDIIIKKLKQK